MNIIAANAAGLKNKTDSLLRLISIFKPCAIFIQETKVKRKQFNFEGYDCYELLRPESDGGGLLTAVHKSLKSVEVSTDSEQEILVVEASMFNQKVRLINGYGPQEYWQDDRRKSFFNQLDLEIKKSKLSGALTCIEMDSNAKLGPTIIPSDPKQQSENGKLLANILSDNNLIVVNGQSLCEGSITRYRKTAVREESSILDHYIVCEEMFKYIKRMNVDETGIYSLTKYSNTSGTKVSVKESDHRTISLELHQSWKPHQSEKEERIEIYDLNDPESFQNFIRITSDNEQLRSCFNNEDEDIEISSKRWLRILKDIMKSCFKKIRVRKDKLKPELEYLFQQKEDIKIRLANAENSQDSDQAQALTIELEKVETQIGNICAERNKNLVEKHLHPFNDTIDGGSPEHIWSLKKKLAPKNTSEPPTAKHDLQGNLISDRTTLEQLYKDTYAARLTPNQISPDLEDLKSLKAYLFQSNFELAQTVSSNEWSLTDLEKALKSLKKHKARDIHGHTYEIFMFSGQDLKLSLLKMYNLMKKRQTYPSIFHSSTITSIWKKKGSKRDLDNERGIFNVTKIRSILDKIIYNDIYSQVDNNMSCSNIGARKNRNIRDHLFVINAILNESVNAPNKIPLDVQIFDVSKCFDKLEYFHTANDLYRAGVSDDKFVLIANSNKTCEVSIKLPWGKCSTSTVIRDIEMQGTVLAPLKCSLSVDRIGKEALEHLYHDLFRYRNCVTIPPLGMVDDILAVTQCSVSSVKINSFIGAKIKCMQLELGQKKCAHMHVGKNDSNCHDLSVNGSKMEKSSREKYLGEILTSDGKIAENITSRYNKGIGTANTIISLIKTVHFGKYFIEMALLFRNSMLINSMLCSIEALYGLHNIHIDKLEKVDKYLMRQILNAPNSTPIEALYLETGAMPIRFLIVSRRLMFYWSILSKTEVELVRKVYNAQKISPIKNDWYLQVKEDLENCCIFLSETEISNMKRHKFKSLVKEKVREQARDYLIKLKRSHSKLNDLDESFKMQQYMVSDELTLDEKRLLFRFRTQTYDCKANYKWNYQDTKCSFCDLEDSQEHLLHCSQFSDLKLERIKYEHIFGPIQEQLKIVKVLTHIDQKRSASANSSSNTGSQAHLHGASCTSNCI